MKYAGWPLMAILVLLTAGCGRESARESGYGPRPAGTAPVIPAPASVQPLQGAFLFTAGTPVLAGSDDAATAQTARWLTGRLRDVPSADPARASAVDDEPSITLVLRGEPEPERREAYELTVEPGGITVEAADPAGLFYGAVTVWQLVTAGTRAGDAIRVPAVRIDDAPRFRWRGLMLDAARHFVAPREVRRMIDWMALHKLNVMHWHLTDDQGWRLEIRQYPRLTEVGAWRVPAHASPTASPSRYGGFYTQDEVREIVAYAASRHVTIVPEIEMPGHAQAAIASYPALGTGSADGEAPRVSADWGIHDYLFNVEESTFEVLENILDEVMAVFPGEYIHVGGDEAVKTRWEESARVQARMRELGIDDEAALQSWFVQRIEAYLERHGRRLIGWDEIMEGGLAPNATVMSWRGIGGALEAAEQGHDTVLSPAPTLYFDHRQSALPGEPPGRGTIVSLADVYAFDPMPAELAPTERRHVLGVQANLWSEHIRTPERLAAMAFPRAAAVAELGWSPAERRSWPDFLERLAVQFERYRALDMPFSTSPFAVAVDADFIAGTGEVQVVLSNQAGFGTIRYTTDGSQPTTASPAYVEPLSLSSAATLATAVFHEGIELARAVHGAAGLLAARRSSRELVPCSENILLQLEDDAPAGGERAVFLVDIMNPCWTWPDADLSGVAGIDVSVGQLPFNFQIGDARAQIETRAPETPTGELEVRAQACNGEVIARLPLVEATQTDSVSTLSADLSWDGAARTDLCLRFNTGTIEPMWVVEHVTLRRAKPSGG